MHCQKVYVLVYMLWNENDICPQVKLTLLFFEVQDIVFLYVTLVPIKGHLSDLCAEVK